MEYDVFKLTQKHCQGLQKNSNIPRKYFCQSHRKKNVIRYQMAYSYTIYRTARYSVHLKCLGVCTDIKQMIFFTTSSCDSHLFSQKRLTSVPFQFGYLFYCYVQAVDTCHCFQKLNWPQRMTIALRILQWIQFILKLVQRVIKIVGAITTQKHLQGIIK